MSAIEFLRIVCPAVLRNAQKLGIVGQAVFDAGRLFERYGFVDNHEYIDGDGI